MWSVVEETDTQTPAVEKKAYSDGGVYEAQGHGGRGEGQEELHRRGLMELSAEDISGR